jgi:hypothetical protein
MSRSREPAIAEKGIVSGEIALPALLITAGSVDNIAPSNTKNLIIDVDR